jgi:hypothetical protein
LRSERLRRQPAQRVRHRPRTAHRGRRPGYTGCCRPRAREYRDCRRGARADCC